MVKIYQIGGTGSDSNVYLIDDDILTLVDAGTGMRIEETKNKIKELGFSPSDIDLLVNTHCHFDHAGGDRDFVEASGCRVAIHELEAPVLERGDGTVSCAAMFGRELKPVKASPLLREGNTLDLGSLALRVLLTPGHTAGSVALHDPDKRVLFSGDTVFCEGVGRTDLPTGDEKALAQSLQRLGRLDVEKLYPGHGPHADRDGEKHIFDSIQLMEP